MKSFVNAFDSNHSASSLTIFPVALLSGLLLLAACDSSGNAQTQPNLRVSTLAITEDTDTTLVADRDTIIFRDGRGTNLEKLEVKATSRSGRVHIYNGYFQPLWGDNPLRHEIEKKGNRVVVSLYVDTNDDDGTHPSITPPPLLYEAWVSNLEAGEYRLVVRHKHDATRDAQTQDAWVPVLDRAVQVQ